MKPYIIVIIHRFTSLFINHENELKYPFVMQDVP